jgi:hypothetical protein
MADHTTILLKMQDGTPRGDAHLCSTCTQAFIRRGVNSSMDLQICNYISQVTGGRRGVITSRIAACTSYYPKHLPQLHELQDIAWEIVSKGERGERRIGFISPADRRAAGIGFNQPAPAPPAIRFER